MRNFTLKPLLFCTALAGMALQGTIKAQDITFRAAENEEAEAIGVNTSDGVPVVADFDNNGFMDLWAPGQTYEWRPTSEVNEDGSVKWDWTWYDDTKLSFNNGDGTWNVKNRDSGTGLPFAYGGISNKAFDFNQDGLVDFIYPSVNVGWTFEAKKALLLAINNGDGTFTMKEDAALSEINPSLQNNKWNQQIQNTTISIADYNKDGYPDLLIQFENENPWERAVWLFKNVEGDHFERVTDPFIPEFGKPFVPQCAGSISFGDFNNDGWPDIVSTGWGDGNEELDINGGGQVHFYRNMKDGTFQLADTDFGEINAISEKLNFPYGEEHFITVVDYDQDGKQDILVFGQTGFQGEAIYAQNGKVALMLRNVSTDEKFAFEEVETQLYPLSGANVRLASLADFNGDGWIDFVARGWNGDWHTAISSSTGSYDGYYITEDIPDAEDNTDPIRIKEAYMAHGDLNNDGLLDLFTQENCDRLSWTINTTEPDYGIQIPGAPEDVKAEYNSDTKQLTVTWAESYTPDTESKAFYNLYLKNKATGKTFMIAPANPENGKQLTYTAFSGYVNPTSYTFEGVEEGNYTVGVQAVTYSWQASEFSTTDVNLNENPTSAFTVVSTDPSGRKEIESLSHITLNFNEEAYPNAMEDAPAITLTNDASEALDITLKKVNGQAKQIQIILPPTIEAGTYTLTVPEKAVCRTNGDWNTTFTKTFTTTGITAYIPTGIEGDEGNYGSLKDFTLTFPEQTNALVNPEATTLAYMVNNDNDYQVPATLSQGNRPNQIKLTLDEELKTEGSYTLIIPEGMIQRVIFTETTEENAENTTVLLTSPEIKYDYTIGLDFAPTGITPAAGKVFSLKDFTIKFAEGTVPQLNEESANQAYLLNSKNGNQVAATLAIGTNTTEVIATLAEEVSAEGYYTLVIPARMIQQTSMDEGDGTAEPTVKTEYAPNLKYDYTIGHDYEPVSITPAEGTVSSLHEFVLQFVADTTYATINTENEDKAYLADNNGESVEEATLAAGDNPNEIKVTLANEVNTKGTYTLVIPAKMIQQSAGEENPTIVDYAPQLEFIFTVTDGQSIESTLNGASTAEVYTISGILIKKNATREDLKGLKKGIYIINGKNMLVK